jgi:cis-3-alkyl-4-acyloxetan-2-one decarboxylase
VKSSVRDIPLPDYPFTGKVLPVNGNNMHYLDEGQGEAIVMLHGNPTWSYFYRHLVLGLRANFRCLVPDHIGMGLSAKPSADAYPYTLSRRVDDLSQWLDQVLPQGQITLVVHDWGGMIGLAWAVANPTRIKRLVILNTAGFPLPKTKRLPFELWLGRNTWLGSFLIRRFNGFAFGATAVATKKPMSKAVRAAYLAPYDTAANRISTLRFVQDIPLSAKDAGYAIVQNVGESLRQFTHVPTLICWGMQDFVFDAHFLKGFCERLPHASVHRFDRAGHYVLEDEGPTILALLQAFLTKSV